MPLLAAIPSKRALEPIDRVSEILFGLIMVLTFTGSLSVVEAGRDDVRAMLVGALGCNLAWGLIDAVLYLMGRQAEHGQTLATFRAVKNAKDPDMARRAIAGAFPPMVARLLLPAEIEALRARLLQTDEPAGAGHLQRSDYRAALAVFLLVFLSIFPVAIPFMVLNSVQHAMRVSNAVAVVLLFLNGFAFGRLTGYRPAFVGAGMMVLGIVLVGLTIALGG